MLFFNVFGSSKPRLLICRLIHRFLSLLRTQQSKNERTRYADVAVGEARFSSGYFGVLTGWAAGRELFTSSKVQCFRYSKKNLTDIHVCYWRVATRLHYDAFKSIRNYFLIILANLVEKTTIKAVSYWMGNGKPINLAYKEEIYY